MRWTASLLTAAVLALTGGSGDVEDIDVKGGRGIERDAMQTRSLVRDDFLARGLSPSTVRCDGAICLVVVDDIGYDLEVDEHGEIEVRERYVVSLPGLEDQELDGLDPLDALQRQRCDVPRLAAEIGAEQSCGLDQPNGVPGWRMHVTDVHGHRVTVHVDER